MKPTQLFLLGALLLGSSAFQPAASPTTTTAAPAAGREVREVGPFTELSLSTSGNVEVRKGATQRVEVEGSSEDLAELETVVKNGRLTIQAKNRAS